MNCEFIEEDGKFRCKHCGFVHRKMVKRNCPTKHIEPPEEQLTSPPTARRLVNFAEATFNHIKTGMRKCTQEEIDQRLEVCRTCELFQKLSEDKGVCTHSSCGCNIARERKFLNKLAWADQKCPLGKWGPIEK